MSCLTSCQKHDMRKKQTILIIKEFSQFQRVAIGKDRLQHNLRVYLKSNYAK